MKKISKVYIAAGVVAIVAVVVWAMSGGKKQEEVSFDTAKVAPANLMTSVTATGTIEPVTSVTVGTQVSGIVSKLYVDYNSVVKKGQVIAELDKTNLVSQLNASKATLASAQSKLNYESANFKRYATLYKKGLVSADEYENAQLTYKQAKDQVATAKEDVQRAQTNLGYATITSPIDGVVLSKSVEEGQTVAASFSTPELFTIAQNLKEMHVVADVDEADLHRHILGGITCSAITEGVTDQATEEITKILRRTHKLKDATDTTEADSDDFNIRSQEELASMMNSTTDMLTILLGCVAGISLIVGGIGIMNIMYVSVTERTREIGLRMSVGARGVDILNQFLIEAILLSVTGGLIGVLFGVGASYTVNLVAHWPISIQPWSIIMSFAVCTFTGVFFGWYPAKKAAQLDPIEAIRYE